MQVYTEKQDTSFKIHPHPTHPPKNPPKPKPSCSFCENEKIHVLKGTDSMYMSLSRKSVHK